MGQARFLELAARPVVYLWQDIAIAGIIVVLAGGPGSGKTTLLFLFIAARLNTGAPVKVLGRDVTPAPAGTFFVLLEAEHAEESTARKLLKSLRLLGVADSALDRLILVARKGVRIGSSAWEDVEKLIAAGLVSDVAIDTLARVAPADANDEADQVEIFERVSQAIEGAPEGRKPLVTVVMHTRKTNGATPGLEDVSGSTQRTGQGDAVLMVSAERRDGRVTSSRVTFQKLREEPDEYPPPCEFVVEKDRVIFGNAPSEKDDRPLEERILERLAMGAKTKNKLSKDLKRNPKDIDDALSPLFATQRIRSTTVNVRGVERKAVELRAPRPTLTQLDISPNLAQPIPTEDVDG
jgi:hypothetical protein